MIFNELDEILVRGDVIFDNLLDVVCWFKIFNEKNFCYLKKCIVFIVLFFIVFLKNFILGVIF